MRNKMQNLQDLEYTNNAILLGELINKWVKSKPKNKELLQFQQAFIDNSIYVAGLQNDLTACKMANSDYREQRNEALYELDLIKEEFKRIRYDVIIGHTETPFQNMNHNINVLNVKDLYIRKVIAVVSVNI